LPLKAFCPDGFKNLKRWLLSPADEVVRFAEKENTLKIPWLLKAEILTGLYFEVSDSISRQLFFSPQDMILMIL
jgi:hypothetical protein